MRRSGRAAFTATTSCEPLTESRERYATPIDHHIDLIGRPLDASCTSSNFTFIDARPKESRATEATFTEDREHVARVRNRSG